MDGLSKFLHYAERLSAPTESAVLEGTMVNRPVFDVIVSRDGSSSIGIVEFLGKDQRRSVSEAFCHPFPLTVRLAPKKSESQIVVLIDEVIVRKIDRISLGSRLTPEEACKQISWYTIGRHLDTSGTPPLRVFAEHAVEELHNPHRPQALDDDVLVYAAVKIFRGWEF